MELNKFIKLTDEEYFSAEGINFSSLKNLYKSPLHYKYLLENPVESTSAQVFGSAVHAYVFDPEEFDKSFFVYDGKLDKRTKEGKEIVEKANGREIVNNDVLKCSFNVLEQFIDYNSLIKENAIFFEDADLLFKAKIDAYDPKEKIIYDLKTTSDITPQAFMRAIYNYKYYAQASHYIRAVEKTGNEVKAYRIIAVEKEAPFDVAIFELSPEYITLGYNELDSLIDILKTSQTFNHWSGVADDKIITVNVPSWALKGEN